MLIPDRYHPRAHALAVVIVTWVPLVGIGLLELLLGRTEPMLKDFSLHVRMLVALPVFIIAERVLDSFCDETVARIEDEQFVPPDREARLAHLVARAKRWRESAGVEAILLMVGLGLGIAALVGAMGPAHEGTSYRVSGVRIWYSLVSLPLFQFLLWRTLWRYFIWAVLLAGLSRIPLRLVASHADRRGGIGYFKRPSVAFCALFLFALSSVLCSTWATQVVQQGAHLATFKTPFAAFFVIVTCLVLAPLLCFAPQLLRGRRKGLAIYGKLVTDQARGFEERHVGARQQVLGDPDASSLIDLTTAVSETVQRMGILLLEPRDLMLPLLFALLPAVPLVALEIPLREVIMKVAGAVGGRGL